MLICKTYFSKLQSDPNSDHTITVYAIKKRTFRDPNSRPGETDPYMACQGRLPTKTRLEWNIGLGLSASLLANGIKFK